MVTSKENDHLDRRCRIRGMGGPNRKETDICLIGGVILTDSIGQDF